MTQEHPDRPTPDDIDALLDKIDAETPWKMIDYNYSSGAYDPSLLSVELEWSPGEAHFADSESEREAMVTVAEICDELDRGDGAPRERVIETATERTGLSEEKVAECLEGLQQRGEVYEPAKGTLRTT